jgi:recombination protein RecA
MAIAKKKKELNPDLNDNQLDDFTDDLIKSLNKERGTRVAYNLSVDNSPTHVNRWISTGSKQLDYIISNRKNGGLPEGRIVEIFGPPSIGKSHIATQIAKSTQKLGGIVVYIDTENATSIDNLHALGVDTSKRFVYVDTHCTEEVMSIAESTIMKAKAMQKDVPVTIIWDSVAATSPKAELLGEYDKDTIGLQARAISKGMRKITGVIANQKVLLVCLNQIRSKIGVMYGDPSVTPGGVAIPFHSSVRIKLGAGAHIEGPDKEPIGINVSAKIIKNKVSAPFRSADFQIIFGKGIREHEEVFDALRKYGEVQMDNKSLIIEGAGAWKSFIVKDTIQDKVLIEKKFYKAEFDKIMNDPQYKDYIDFMIDKAYTRTQDELSSEDLDIDPNSYVEQEAIAQYLVESETYED